MTKSEKEAYQPTEMLKELFALWWTKSSGWTVVTTSFSAISSVKYHHPQWEKPQGDL